ncbi:NACHT domain-containing protein [Candidatus Neptunochlamydia vexilliferae]|uniref:NACHT domain-containing protein n=1 Tax=Candidatus Neptunichlamydia vexilliferae TaxID=1651774 RepID=A0ABS0B0Y1_9BACT|nr:NACHT domain-containing protein [Candidatus Neptunochlamydia vexilliferae]MBF5060050.1 hypothetical protein [Candidatus Neptunochlamydia vexilliferae]
MIKVFWLSFFLFTRVLLGEFSDNKSTLLDSFISIGFKDKQEKAKRLFKDEEIYKYALKVLKSIEEIDCQISLEIEEYKQGEQAHKNSILGKIDYILTEVISDENYPPSPDSLALDSLSSFLDPIRRKYEHLKAFFDQDKKDQEEKERRLLSLYDKKKTQLFKLEQQELHRSVIFNDYLERLRVEFEKTPHKSAYCVYAWPTDERREKEKWVQPFLRAFKKSLGKAGFSKIGLDIETNRYGKNINSFMKGAESSDYVLLFGTESLFDKHDKGISAVCTELNHIIRKREKDNKSSLTRVFPILLSGEHRKSFPVGYERFSTIRDWREGGYLKHFQDLFIELLGLCPEKFREKMEKLWEESSQAYPERKKELRLRWFAERREELEGYRCNRDFIGLSNFSIEGRDMLPTVEDLSKHLQSYYKKQRTSVYKVRDKKAWQIFFPIEGIYTNLFMIDSLGKKEIPESSLRDKRPHTHELLFGHKECIQPQKLFNYSNLKNASSKRVAITGAAGAGKTTFCQMAAIEGTNLWPEFNAVFFVKFRHFKEVSTLDPYEILAKGGGFDLREYKHLLEDSMFRNKALLVLDGYDELASEEENAFYELQSLFPHILVTSRPAKIDMDYVRELEIIGFDEMSIQTYINKFYLSLVEKNELTHEEAEQKAKNLQREIDQRPNLKSLVKIPLNLALACSLFREDETFFDSNHTLSVTGFYIEAVSWFYKRYQLRSRKSSYLTRNIRQQKDPRKDDLKIKRLAEVLEAIAWKAMESSALYLEQDDIEDIIEKKGGRLNDLTDIGIINIEDEKGEFIHLTFQEYFAASHLAQFYLNGNYKAGREILQKIKFDPRYTLMLRMTSGLLSHTKKQRPFQAFFDDLFLPPKDLAHGYELRLLAQCFEECLYPQKIDQYEGFTKKVVNYMQSTFPEKIYFLLRHNVKLANQPIIVEEISRQLRSPKKQMGILEGLTSLASNGQLFPAVGKVALEMARNTGLDNETRAKAALALRVTNKEDFGKKELEFLIKTLKEKEVNNDVQVTISFALAEIVNEGVFNVEEAMQGLIDVTKNKEEQNTVSWYSGLCLGVIAKEKGILGKKAWEALLEIAQDREFEGSSVAAMFGFSVCAKEKNFKDSRVLKISEQIIKTKELNGSCYCHTARVLKEIAKTGGPLAEAAIKILVEAAKDKELDRHALMWTIEALGKVSKGKGPLGKKAGDALEEIAVGCGLDECTLGDVSQALADIIKGGRVLDNKTVKVLKKAAHNESLGAFAKVRVASTLAKIDKGLGPTAKEGTEVLVEIICNKELDLIILEVAVQALGKIGRENGGISKEGAQALVELIKDKEKAVTLRREAAAALGRIAKTILTKEEMQVVVELVKSERVGFTTADGVYPWCDTYILKKILESTGVREALEMMLEIIESSKFKYPDFSLVFQDIEKIESRDLAMLIKDNASSRLALKACYLTGRAFFISGDKIVISDGRQQVEANASSIDTKRLASVQVEKSILENNIEECPNGVEEASLN